VKPAARMLAGVMASVSAAIKAEQTQGISRAPVEFERPRSTMP
jgi:hypothetical protein